MSNYDVTSYPDGYKKVLDEELDFLHKEEREGYMIGLIKFMITC